MNIERLARLARQAGGSLLARPMYALLMMAGLVVGIASVTVIYQMGQGVRDRVLGMMSSMGFGAHAFYVASGSGRLGFRHGRSGALTLTPQDVDMLLRLDGVELVVPHLNLRRTEISAGGRHNFTWTVGTTPDYISARKWGMAQGRFLNWNDLRDRRRVAVLGATTAAEMFPKTSALGQTMRLGRVPMVVVGVLAAKGTNWRGRDRDDRILVPVTTAQRRLARLDKFSGIRVNLLPTSDKTAMLAQVTQLLRRSHRLGPESPDDFMIITPEALLALITQQSRALVQMLTIISAVSLLVAGMVIMNIMLVAVGERTAEIGLRRALGARQRDITLQFLLESLLISLTGGALGLGLGMLLSKGVTLLMDLPTSFSLQGFAVSCSFSILVGLVFGLLPARRASKLEPAQCIR